MGMTTARGRGVGELVQPPVVFRKAPSEGFAEFQVRLDPGDIVQLVLKEQNAVPKVAVAKRDKLYTLKDESKTVVDITAVRNDVRLAVDAR